MDGLTDIDIAELEALCPGGVTRNVDLSAVSQWQVGGSADLFLRPSSSAEVAALMRWFWARGTRPVVIGLTSNLLFDDAGLRVPCLQIGRGMADVQVAGTEVRAGAGCWIPGLARRLMQAGLGGAEHICGIPGTLGGLICMNGGSQRLGIGISIVDVESVDAAGNIRTRKAQDCDFAYRQSIFQANGDIITAGRMRFTRRTSNEIRTEMRAILADRRRKFPRKEPNCGSVFKSDPVMYSDIGPPGAAIEKLGFKGKSEGGALVSPRHANFIVNTGDATARDILTLISRISNAVETETGYRMVTEVSFVRADGTICSADTALTESTS